MRQGEDVSLRPSAPTILADLAVSASPILPPIYTTCTFVSQLSGEIGFLAMTVTYGTELLLHFINHLRGTRFDRPVDFLAFSVIVYLVVRSNVNKIPIPSIFKTIARDATYYFLVIFTSHLILVMFLAFTDVSAPS